VSPLLQSLDLGKVPRVVGTIITEQFLTAWRDQPRKLPCDIVELRVDGYPAFPDWLSIGEQIQEYETPVFATLRLAKEGGKWRELDSDRWPLLEQAVRRLAGIDVELESELADFAAQLSAELKKLCVLSHHDFEKTPPKETMRQMLQRAHERGCIGKIAATVHTPEDLANLRSLLDEKWPLPICLIGMGALGRETRLSFPREGSCFTYGYLDIAGAPGQYSAAELMRHFGRS
jgi:3-dehydroquinate dehydratase-1